LKLHKKYEHLTFTFLMALGMSCIISFFAMLINAGIHSFNIERWLSSWGIAFVIAFPTAYFLPRFIRKIMSKITFVEDGM